MPDFAVPDPPGWFSEPAECPFCPGTYVCRLDWQDTGDPLECRQVLTSRHSDPPCPWFMANKRPTERPPRRASEPSPAGR